MLCGFNHSYTVNSDIFNGGEQKKDDHHNEDRGKNGDDILIEECVEMQAIIYFYGDDDPDRRLKVYEKCIEKLSLAIKKRLVLNLENRSSGIIVKCHGCLSNPSDSMKNLINNIIKLFHIDVILCIDDELTLIIDDNNKYNKNDLSSYWKYRFIAIEGAVKSGGVVVREQAERLAIGRNIIRNYYIYIHIKLEVVKQEMIYYQQIKEVLLNHLVFNLFVLIHD